MSHPAWLQDPAQWLCVEWNQCPSSTPSALSAPSASSSACASSACAVPPSLGECGNTNLVFQAALVAKDAQIEYLKQQVSVLEQRRKREEEEHEQQQRQQLQEMHEVLVARAGDEQCAAAAERRALAAEQCAAAAEGRAFSAERRAAIAEQCSAAAMQRKEGLGSAATRVVLWQGRVIASGPAPEAGAKRRAAEARSAAMAASERWCNHRKAVAKACRLKRSVPGGKGVLWLVRRQEEAEDAVAAAEAEWGMFS